MFALANPQAGQPQEKRSDPLGVLYFLAVVHSNCIIVFCRSGFGKEALGFRGLLSLLALFVASAFEIQGLGRTEYAVMPWWLLAFLLAVIVQRIITWRAIRKGTVIHTLYGGKPLLTKVPFFGKDRDAMILEMIVCFALGAMMFAVSQFAAIFLMMGFFSLMVRTGIEETVYGRRLDRMRDAQIEGRWLGDRMR